MTFDRWFAQTFPAGYSPDGQDDVLPMRAYMAQAWQAALDARCISERGPNCSTNDASITEPITGVNNEIPCDI